MSIDIAARQQWLATLAHSRSEDLLRFWQQLEIDPECEVIRQPEVGLTRLQGRMGGTGDAFNFADTTITRAVIRLADGTLGYGFIQGRDKHKAMLVAIADALLQQTEFHLRLQTHLIQPLAELQQLAKANTAKEMASSKVDFFTLVRGED